MIRSALLWLACCASALAGTPDCGDNGGAFGRQFSPQYDRPEIPVVFVYVADTDAACRATFAALRQHPVRILECADVELQLDGRHGFVLVPHGASEWLKNHGACHIRYGYWHTG